MTGSTDFSLFDPASMSSVVSSVLDDCLYNIISDTVLKVHREEKQARMQSAAIIAQQAKDAAKAEASPGGAPLSITTTGAIIDEEDKIYLHENPLRTTTEILCPVCRLPQLQYPITGRGARPSDPAKEYCARQPYISKEGCDIYGKSLAIEKPSKKKTAASQTKKNASQGASGSRSGSESPGGSPNGTSKDSKPAATQVPTGKCPNCPRYMAFTRIAQHMDRCMGLSGRQSSKNALNKLQASTPRDGSRAGTPKPLGPGGTASLPVVNGKKRKFEKASDDEDADDAKSNSTTATNRDDGGGSKASGSPALKKKKSSLGAASIKKERDRDSSVPRDGPPKEKEKSGIKLKIGKKVESND